jgi:DNA-binding CsgD family transcriptional regulator
MTKRSGIPQQPRSGNTSSLESEVDRLRHVVAVHCEALALDRTVVYAVDFREDAFSYISPYVEELTGFALREWQRPGAYPSMMARCHAADRSLIEAATEQLCQQPRALDHCTELKYRWKDNFGRWRWCFDRFRLLVDDHGRPAHMFGSFREVTEQVETARLRQSLTHAEVADQSGRNLPGDSGVLAAMIDTGGLGLTPIQREVLELILAGLSNKQIALRLRRSIRTIEDHRYRIMRKVGADNTVDLVKKVLRLRSVPGGNALSQDGGDQ